MADENIFLLYALFLGIFITFVYDILRIVRRVFPHGGFLVSLEDLCFWVYCAAEVFLLMYRLSDGTLRWFAVFGALAGMILYRKLISPWFVKYVSMVLGKLVEIFSKVFQFLLRPAHFLLQRMGRGMKKAKGKAARSRNKMKGLMKKKLTFFLKVLKMTL